MSQRQIAALTGQSQSEVSEILKGRQVMAYDVLARIADGLGVPRGYMGLAYDEATALKVAGSVDEAEQREDEEVKRRRFPAARRLRHNGRPGARPGQRRVGADPRPRHRRRTGSAPPTCGRSRPRPGRCARWTTSTAAGSAGTRWSPSCPGTGSCSEVEAAEPVKHRLFKARRRHAQPGRLDLVRHRLLDSARPPLR
ncbi:helix-turn-helix domain-containing protein [Kutzneria kofuensis]|uniref:helix-turn-helix domain-containing protein n=1 Tax=Kutzneria kofuensis TaxID=103725 RepID=UPI00338752A1